MLLMKFISNGEFYLIKLKFLQMGANVEVRYCETKYCLNVAIHDRKICEKCKSAKYRAKHPLENSYRFLKANAKRRGKDFDLTLEQWRQFCLQTNYLNLRGTSATDYSVDRIRGYEGYNKDNIQILTVAENSRKKNKERNFKFQTKEEAGTPF